MRQSASQARSVLARLATAGIAGQVVLLASALLLPLVSEYRLVGDTISELALGRFGLVQSVAFLIAGVSTLGVAVAIRALTRGAWGSLIGSLLVAVYGLGAVLVALFPTDRIDRAEDVWSQSTTGTIHVVVSLVSFVAMIAGMFILSRTFMLESRWRSLVPWSILFPAAALSLLFVQSEGPWVGIMQRLLVGAIAAWIIVVAFRIRAITASPLNPHRDPKGAQYPALSAEREPSLH
jgi:hypothetical protein